MLFIRAGLPLYLAGFGVAALPMLLVEIIVFQKRQNILFAKPPIASLNRICSTL